MACSMLKVNDTIYSFICECFHIWLTGCVTNMYMIVCFCLLIPVYSSWQMLIFTSANQRRCELIPWDKKVSVKGTWKIYLINWLFPGYVSQHFTHFTQLWRSPMSINMEHLMRDSSLVVYVLISNIMSVLFTLIKCGITKIFQPQNIFTIKF